MQSGEEINALCFSPNRYWLCAAAGPIIKIWDLEQKTVVEELKPEVSFRFFLIWAFLGRELWKSHILDKSTLANYVENLAMFKSKKRESFKKKIIKSKYLSENLCTHQFDLFCTSTFCKIWISYWSRNIGRSTEKVELMCTRKFHHFCCIRDIFTGPEISLKLIHIYILCTK